LRLIQVVADPFALARAAAVHFLQVAQTAILKRDRFCVVLSGGSTPRAMFQQLRLPANSQQVNWQKVHLFWGDERCVPADHADSNYQMTRQALLNFVSIPPRNLHRIPGEFEPQGAAEAYERELRAFFGSNGLPCFDLILLGLGEDGHTASLFPGSPQLQEQECWVAAVEHQTPPPPLVNRVTLTFPVINAATQVLFLVAGSAKADILAKVLRPVETGQVALPAQQVVPLKGKLTWLVDQAAASKWDGG